MDFGVKMGIGSKIGRWFDRKINHLLIPRMRADYRADGFGVRRKNLSFLSEPEFAEAWNISCGLNASGWQKRKNGVPDIRWRAHICCWAAQHALSLEGDFAECGVHTGILSLTLAHYLRFDQIDKRFWLFDTYEGIPLIGLDENQRIQAEALNDEIYFDVYDIAKQNFQPFPNAILVKGILPQSADNLEIGKIAYLSVDLNHAPAEKSTIELFWPKLVPGALIVIDDYAFEGHESQYHMWNEFARSVGKMVATLPTGQGLLIK